MNLDEFCRRVESWRLDVGTLLRSSETETLSQPELLKSALFELKTGLAELALAESKLRQQNSELLSALIMDSLKLVGANSGELGHKYKDGRSFPTQETVTVLKDGEAKLLGYLTFSLG